MTAVQDRPIRRRHRGTAQDEWSGPWRRYDIVKEFVIATAVVAVLTVLLAVVFLPVPLAVYRLPRLEPPSPPAPLPRMGEGNI